jgi:predicted nucleotidyltransferase
VDGREVARQFSAAVRGALGDRLESVVLYGSVARGEFIDGVSDINVLVLLDDISGSSLGQLAPVVRKFRKQRVHPIVVERREWQRAADVFAIELTEMQEWHDLLHGQDPLMGLLVQPSLLRLQAERELRGKLLQLHLGMLGAETPEQLGGLLVAAAPSMVTYFRSAQRLAQQDVARDSERTIREGCALVGADPAGMLRVLEARRSRKPLNLNLQDPLIDQFNTAAEQLATYIDNVGR